MAAPAEPTNKTRHVNGLVVSGVAQVALGALTGVPYAIAVSRPELLRAVGIRAPRRIRQLHLDLIMMGGLVALVGTAVPEPPRWISIALATGGWANALAFAPLAIEPAVVKHPIYRTAVAASFLTTTTGWLALTAVAARRLRKRAR
jgi:hypothetical protein